MPHSKLMARGDAARIQFRQALTALRETRLLTGSLTRKANRIGEQLMPYDDEWSVAPLLPEPHARGSHGSQAE